MVTVEDNVIPKSCFTFSPFPELLEMTVDHDYLVDVIGLLTSVGEEKGYQRNAKSIRMIVVELAADDLKIRCALFGDFEDQINEFLASGYAEQPVVIVHLAKVKIFRGQFGLQNVMFATKLHFNADLPEVHDFRQSLVRQGVVTAQPLVVGAEGKLASMEDDFLRLTSKCSIEELHEKKQDGFFVLAGTITDVLEEGPWWYSGCSCGKSVRPRSGAYYYDSCGSHYTSVTPRYRVTVCVSDETSQGIFVLFDREAAHLLRKSCSDLFKEVQMDADLISGDTYPLIFKDLVGTRVLLKVDGGSGDVDNFFGNYRVRRLCDDDRLIKMFEDSNAGTEVLTPVESKFVRQFGSGDGETSNGLKETPQCYQFLAQEEFQVCGLDEISPGIVAVASKVPGPILDRVSRVGELAEGIKQLLDSPLKEEEVVLSDVVHIGEASGYGSKVNVKDEKAPMKRFLLVEFDSEDDDDFVPASKVQKGVDE